jgi:alpha-1,6-mannosyltransferase
VAVAGGTTLGLLACGFGTQADRTAPLTVVGCLALAVLVGLEVRRPVLAARPLLAVAVVLLVVGVVVPPRTSHDLWSYAMYGRIVAVHHADPYVVPPSAFPADPALQRVDAAWRSARSVYGPVFTGLSGGVSLVTGGRPLPTRLAYQGMSALAIAVTLFALTRRGRTAAVAAIGLNPLVVVALVNGGHNDAVVGLLILVAAGAVARRQAGVGGALLAAAALIKLTALLPALALVAWTGRRHGTRSAVIVGGTSIGLVTAAYAAVGGSATLRPLTAATGRVSRASLFALLPLGDRNGHREVAVLVLVVGIPAVILTLSRLRGSAMAAAAAGVVPYLLAGPYVLPWYFAWAIPLLAFADDDLLMGVVFAESLLLEVAYTYRAVASPDLLDRLLRTTTIVTRLFECLALVVLVVAAAVLDARRRRTLLRSTGFSDVPPRWRPHPVVIRTDPDPYREDQPL